MKRRAVKFFALLLAGAIINVAVAWGCAVKSPFRSSAPTRLTESELVEHLGWTGGGKWGGSKTVSLGKTLIQMSDGHVASAPGLINDPEMFVEVTRCGWPYHTFQKREQLSILHLLAPRNAQITFSSLPKDSLNAGFAINTIFYAAILYALFAVLGAVRRRVRCKRGQCAACGYSLRDITSEKCPECGSSVSARRADGM